VEPQLAPGDDLCHPVSPVCREAPTIRAFPAVPVSHRRQGKACRRRLSAAQIRRKGEKCIAGAWCRFHRWWCERLWSGRKFGRGRVATGSPEGTIVVPP
jgi:hypothetical protein